MYNVYNEGVCVYIIKV